MLACENRYEDDIRPLVELARALRAAVVAIGMNPELTDADLNFSTRVLKREV
jgi:hypothetical protein